MFFPSLIIHLPNDDYTPGSVLREDQKWKGKQKQPGTQTTGCTNGNIYQVTWPCEGGHTWPFPGRAMTGKNVRDEQGSYYFGQEWYGVFLALPSFLGFSFKERKSKSGNQHLTLQRASGIEQVCTVGSRRNWRVLQRGSAVRPAPAPGRPPPAAPPWVSVCPSAGGDNSGIYFTDMLLRKLNRIIHVKFLAGCLAHHKHWINVDSIMTSGKGARLA